VNVSSIGGLRYLFNVAYGVGKAACDRMAADCALELKGSNVAMVSLWPGAVRYLPRTVLRIFCLPGSGLDYGSP
jgi:NAD(P)-dependent dehydrogenase (short-subunit alcohol dehydrogenase family)